MTAYYNEIDPFAAQWLRNLIAADLIAPGYVDTRSIEDVRPSDLTGFTQCHFFAGIGGWSYALRLAGWHDSRPVWTGSCPCQPFSAAGKGAGFDDERHLWPAWFHLISEFKPPVIFGEQVANALSWLDLIQADLEASKYSCGAIALPAASIGAPHIRQRLWFVANSEHPERRAEYKEHPETYWRDGSGGSRELSELEHARRAEKERLLGIGVSLEPKQKTRRPGYADSWKNVELIRCADGKERPTQPGIFPLAHGVPNRMGALRGYGNAIVPQVAAQVIRAYMEFQP